eukprot:10354692-Alexandrium_andersonii.AAC.1
MSARVVLSTASDSPTPTAQMDLDKGTKRRERTISATFPNWTKDCSISVMSSMLSSKPAWDMTDSASMALTKALEPTASSNLLHSCK